MIEGSVENEDPLKAFRVFSPARPNRSFPMGSRRLLTVGAARSFTSCLARKAPITLGINSKTTVNKALDNLYLVISMLLHI